MSKTNEWCIRACRADEGDGLLELWREAEATPSVTDTVEDVQRMISTGTVLVAEANGELVGSVFGVFDGWRANIYRLAVHPSYRRQGVARALVGEVEKRLVRLGAKRFAAIVEVDHPWAIGFWEAVGYSAKQPTVRYTRNV
ncbi:MAG TPA: GNAT family N-acetyltransferase [Gemmataceae bacterium]|jgi:ribosomal protein S18 acetylase RimI-like enzyme|nr:GNAT family N-acetyltransferase [Gemmataceae bacterium]